MLIFLNIKEHTFDKEMDIMKMKKDNKLDGLKEVDFETTINFVNNMAELGEGNHVLECPVCSNDVLASTIMSYGSLHGRAKCTKCDFLVLL